MVRVLNVIPWRNFIWLLLHALRDLPPSEVMVVIRGCRKLASEMGSQCEKGESFVWSGFSSTATTVDVMQTFLVPGEGWGANSLPVAIAAWHCKEPQGLFLLP